MSVEQAAAKLIAIAGALPTRLHYYMNKAERDAWRDLVKALERVQ